MTVVWGMGVLEKKAHWEEVYQSKQLTDLTWYQARPDVSLNFLHKYKLPKTARIIDVGGGDSLLVDYLLIEGYENITVLDISEKALDRAKARLGDKATKVKWVVSDVTQFIPDERYDFWHDRAAFHFLTEENDVERYTEIAQASIVPAGLLVLGTFSENGPEKCSGLTVTRYSEKLMKARFSKAFEKLKCLKVQHLSPSKMVQEYIFCSFKRLNLG